MFTKNSFIVKSVLNIMLLLCSMSKSNAQEVFRDKAVPDSSELSFKRITFFAIPYSGPIVIKSNRQYKSFCEKNAKEALRLNYKLPKKINFRKYVLMGFGTGHNEPTMQMDNHLYKIVSKKVIVFDITIIRTSIYDIGFDQQYWILVEKPKKGKYTYHMQMKEVSHLNK